MLLVQGGFDCIKRHITLVVLKKYGSFPRRLICNLIRQWLTSLSSPCGSDELVLRPVRSPNLTSFEFSYGGSGIVRLICSFWTKKLERTNTTANDKFDSYWWTVRAALAAVRNSARDCIRRQDRQFANDLVIPLKKHIVYHYLVHI